MKKIKITKKGAYEYRLREPVIFLVDTADPVKIRISSYIDSDAYIETYFVPLQEGFNIEASVNVVVVKNVSVVLKADTWVANALNAPKLPELKNMSKGRVVINQRVLMFSDCQVNAVPEFSILPGGIEQIHGLVIFSLEPEQVYFLQSRGVKRLFRLWE